MESEGRLIAEELNERVKLGEFKPEDKDAGRATAADINERIRRGDKLIDDEEKGENE